MTFSRSSSTAEDTRNRGAQRDPAGSVADRLLAPIIRSIDFVLRRYEGIFEFSADDRCAFRLSFRAFDEAHEWPDGTRVEAGFRVGELHLRTEHLSALGAVRSLGFAGEFRRRLVYSMHALAAYASRDPQGCALPGFFADSWTGGDYTSASLARILLRWGFRIDEESKKKEFWRGLYVRLLARTFHPDIVRGSYRRVRIWISRDELIRRYGGPGTDGNSGNRSM